MQMIVEQILKGDDFCELGVVTFGLIQNERLNGKLECFGKVLGLHRGDCLMMNISALCDCHGCILPPLLEF